ncbi:hypothetical protein QP158_12530, partial [Streptococcus agalactiae]|nr:hypothetical protein [Streptococcus agalactiae]
AMLEQDLDMPGVAPESRDPGRPVHPPMAFAATAQEETIRTVMDRAVVAIGQETLRGFRKHPEGRAGRFRPELGEG